MTKMRWRRCEWRVTTGPKPAHVCNRVAYWQEAGWWYCKAHWAIVTKRVTR